MRLLLGSGGFRTEQRRQRLFEQMRVHFGPVERILFVPFALADHDRYLEVMLQEGFNAGYQLDGIHQFEDRIAAVETAEAIFIGGGNTFRLVNDLHRHRLLDPIRRRIRQGMPYLGISAGTNVACPTLMTTNDMPIVMPPSFTALNLVPFQINPHYFAGQVFIRDGEEYRAHFGETRDDRIREFHEVNALPVVGLWEGGMLHINGEACELLAAPARIFRKGAEPEDAAPGARLDRLLSP